MRSTIFKKLLRLLAYVIGQLHLPRRGFGISRLLYIRINAFKAGYISF